MPITRASTTSSLSRSRRVLLLALTAACATLGAVGCVATRGANPSARRSVSVFDLPADRFIYIGMDVEMLTRLVGKPSGVARAPRGEIWYYEFGAVVVEEGRVTYKYPPSSTDAQAAEPLPDQLQSN